MLKILSAGDIFLGGELFTTVQNDPFAPLKNWTFNPGNALFFANLETPFADAPPSLTNALKLHSSHRSVEFLKHLNVTAVSLANNHIFDCGTSTYQETKQTLSDHNIAAFGAGMHLKGAAQPFLLEKSGKKITNLAFAWNLIGAHYASEKSAGVNPLKKQYVLSEIKKAQKNSDLVIVHIHWGYEKETLPLPSQREFAHAMIDAGATLILGHHSHIVQGIEKYQKGIIAYSLGNFLFAPYKENRWSLPQTKDQRTGLLLELSIEGSTISDVKAHRTYYDDHKGLLYEGEWDLKQLIQPWTKFNHKDYKKYWKKHRKRKGLPDLFRYPKMGMFLYQNPYLLRAINKLW